MFTLLQFDRAEHAYLLNIQDLLNRVEHVRVDCVRLTPGGVSSLPVQQYGQENFIEAPCNALLTPLPAVGGGHGTRSQHEI